MDNREELEETLALLRYIFEELKEIREGYQGLRSLRDYEPARIQELIWKIGEKLGEF